MRYSTTLTWILALSMGLLLTACGGKENAGNDGPRYLDSTFVEAEYRATLDALSVDTSIAKPDRESIRAFIRKYRKRIPEGWTYGRILESANGIKKLRSEALELEVISFQRREVDRIIELHTELKLHNQGDKTIEMAYGDILFSDSTGQRIHASPLFAVQGPIAPGQSTPLLRLQYAYERPTGNALNDSRLAAMRDTLNMLKEFAKKADHSRMRFRTRDLLLEGGLNVEDHYLLEGDALKAAAKPTQKAQGLLEWAKEHEVLIQQLANRDADKYLSVRPVLTDGYESQHGAFLLFDRRLKVVKFFTQQQDVPGRNIDPEGASGTLESRHNVDFWGWPVELWVYAKQR